MALQGSGPIWLSQIQAEFGGPNYWMTSYYRGGGYVTNGAGNQGIPTGGTIWFSQFFNTYKTFTGSYNRTSNISSTTVTVPPHSWLRMRVWGAGGGGGDVNSNGAAGGLSRVSGHLQATGGKGGIAYVNGRTGGAGGEGSGGNHTNSTGGAGATAPIADGTGGRGGNGASGGSGGSPSRANTQAGNGGSPGGGGGGHGTSGGGGGGGYSRSEYGADNRTLQFTITVGNGGAGGGSYGGNGADGRVFIEWGE